jgi:ABC-type spermidine/putrescine transport system permease subunit I
LLNWNRSDLLLVPTSLYYLAFLIVPSIMFCVVSFYGKSDSGFYDGILTTRNYISVLSDKFYLGSLWLTLRISLETTGLCLLLGYPAAYFLSKLSSSARKRLIILLLFPLLLSTVIRVYGWIALLARRGLINQFLLAAGWTSSPVPLLYNEMTVLVGLTSILLPYMIINITNTLITIDASLREAAAIHGASPTRIFLFVTFPLSTAGVISGAVTVFTIAMSTYIISFLLGGPRTKLIGNLIFDATSSFNWPLGAALSVVLVIATMLSSFAIMQLLSRDELNK